MLQILELDYIWSPLVSKKQTVFTRRRHHRRRHRGHYHKRVLAPSRLPHRVPPTARLLHTT